MGGQQPKDHFCPSTRRVEELQWEGDSTLVPSDPSSPVQGPAGKEGSETKGSLGESKHQQDLLCGWSFGGLGRKRRLLHREQSGGSTGLAQHLLPPAPLAPEPPFPHLNPPYIPACFPAKEPTTSRDTEHSSRSLAERIHPCQLPWKREDSTHDSLKRKPRKTRQDRDRPKLPGQAAANKQLEQM